LLAQNAGPRPPDSLPVGSILHVLGNFSERSGPHQSWKYRLAVGRAGQLPAVGQAIKYRMNFMSTTANRASV